MDFPIYLAVDHLGFGVPYWRDDSESHSYIDLKQTPDQISLLPETRGWPELEKAIQDVNAHALFETTGCAKWFTNHKERSDVLVLNGYLGFALSDARAKRTHQYLYDLFHAFTLFLSHKQLTPDLRMRFEVKSTGFNGDMIAGWSADLCFFGWGTSETDAFKLPNLALSLFLEFIETDSVKNWRP